MNRLPRAFGLPYRALREMILGLAALATFGATAAMADMRSDRSLKDLQTINALLDARPGQTFHMILVHGIRTSDRNTWNGFRAKLCRHLAAPHQCVDSPPTTPVTERLVLAAQIPTANFLGKKIWKTDAEFADSQPFVDHWEFRLRDGGRLVLDEVNWWPLALALKCQFLVGDDTDFAGPNPGNIDNCTALDALHHAWFTKDYADALKKTRPASGGAPLANRVLKTEILDWGISDAVLSLGTMKALLRETIRCAFDDILIPQNRSYAQGVTQPGTYTCYTETPGALSTDYQTGNFIIASHSLGAFLLLDTFAAAAADAGDSCKTDLQLFAAPVARSRPSYDVIGGPRRHNQSLCLALAGSNRLYFFANQFSLLELGRAQGLDGSQDANVSDALSLWAAAPGAETRRQVVAFSDPGDLLTFKVPGISGADIFNIYPENDFRWFGLLEWPSTAHTKYLTNDKVLKVMFGI